MYILWKSVQPSFSPEVIQLNRVCSVSVTLNYQMHSTLVDKKAGVPRVGANMRVLQMNEAIAFSIERRRTSLLQKM